MNDLTPPQTSGALQVMPQTQNIQQWAQSVLPKTFEQTVQLAEFMAKSGLAPAAFHNKPEACLIAIIAGASLGFNPLQSVKSIAVINGTPCLWGDAMIALVRASPLCEWIKETFEGQTAYCTVKRKGDPEPQMRSYSWDEATQAGLTSKKGTVWQQYSKRMLQMRARGFALRDIFPDVLAGFSMAEEMRDITPNETAREQFNAPVIQQKPTYTDEQFNQYFPEWQTLIESGKRMPAQLVAMIESKYQLTEQQKAQVLALSDKTKSQEEQANDRTDGE